MHDTKTNPVHLILFVTANAKRTSLVTTDLTTTIQFSLKSVLFQAPTALAFVSEQLIILERHIS